VNDFLRGRAVLRRAIVLIDSRHGVKPVDVEIMEMLDGAAVNYQLVLTKTDKVKASDLAKTLERTAAEAAKHAAAHPQLIATSSETGEGIAELRTAILEAATT
jgi:GTP-binding protein